MGYNEEQLKAAKELTSKSLGKTKSFKGAKNRSKRVKVRIDEQRYVNQNGKSITKEINSNTTLLFVLKWQAKKYSQSIHSYHFPVYNEDNLGNLHRIGYGVPK